MKNIFEIDYGIVQRFTMENWQPLSFDTEIKRIEPTFIQLLNDFHTSQQPLDKEFSEVLYS